jgi:hypothetical protein
MADEEYTILFRTAMEKPQGGSNLLLGASILSGGIASGRYSGAISRMKQETSALQGTITRTRSELATSNRQIETLRSDLSTSNRQIETLRSDLSTSNSQFERLQDNVIKEMKEKSSRGYGSEYSPANLTPSGLTGRVVKPQGAGRFQRKGEDLIPTNVKVNEPQKSTRFDIQNSNLKQSEKIELQNQRDRAEANEQAKVQMGLKTPTDLIPKSGNAGTQSEAIRIKANEMAKNPPEKYPGGRSAESQRIRKQELDEGNRLLELDRRAAINQDYYAGKITKEQALKQLNPNTGWYLSTEKIIADTKSVFEETTKIIQKLKDLF